MRSLLFILSIVLITIFGSACAPSAPTAEIKHQSYNVMVSKKIYIDSRFNTDEVAIIEQAAQTIESNTNNIVHYDLVKNFEMNDHDPSKYIDKIMIRKCSSEDVIVKRIDAAINEELGVEPGTPDSAMIYGYTLKKPVFEFILIVADRIKTKDMYLSVVMHESLHELGLLHYDNQLSVMNTTFDIQLGALAGTRVTPITCMTRIDAEQFCSLYLCRPEDLNYCK